MFSPSALIDKVKNAVSSKQPGKSGSTGNNPKAVTFNDIKNLSRPAPTWRWSLIMPATPSDTIAQKTSNNPILKAISKFLSSAPDSRVIMCEAVEVAPNINLGRQDRYFNGKMVTFPGLPSVTPITAVFYESEDYSTTDYFRKWQNNVYDPARNIYGVPAEYCKDIEFVALPITDNSEVTRYMSIMLKNCWPVEISKYSYGSTTDRIKIQVEFAYHDLEVTIVGGPQSSSKLDLGSIVNKAKQWMS